MLIQEFSILKFDEKRTIQPAGLHIKFKFMEADLKNKNGEPAGTRVEIHIPIMT